MFLRPRVSPGLATAQSLTKVERPGAFAQRTMNAMQRTSSKKIWLLLGAGLAAAIGVHALRGESSSSPHLLVGRVWVDRIPTKDTEHFEAFLVLEDPSMGVFQRTSSYEGSFEIFKYEPRGDGKLQMLFPQSKTKFEVKYDAKTCNESGFDYCLAMTGAPRGATKYVSKKGWEIEGDNVAQVESSFEDWKDKNLPKE
jgi:hypothetical protein